MASQIEKLRRQIAAKRAGMTAPKPTDQGKAKQIAQMLPKGNVSNPAGARAAAEAKYEKNWKVPKDASEGEKKAFFQQRGERTRKLLENKYGSDWKSKVYGPDFNQKKMRYLNNKRDKVAGNLELNSGKQTALQKAIEGTTDEARKTALQARLEKIQARAEKLTAKQERISSTIKEKYTDKRKAAATTAAGDKAAAKVKADLAKYKRRPKGKLPEGIVMLNRRKRAPYSAAAMRARLKALKKYRNETSSGENA